jgi:hypothetical protein
MIEPLSTDRQLGRMSAAPCVGGIPPARSGALVLSFADSSLLPPLYSLRAAPGLSLIERRAVTTKSFTEPLTEAARAALETDELERDREAWNLPRAPGDTNGAYQGGLDWDGFRDLYFPESRRHNLKAIAAYGAYKKSSPPGRQPASEAAYLNGDPISTDVVSLDEWEDEGGASP